jgi:hypothetical protein
LIAGPAYSWTPCPRPSRPGRLLPTGTVSLQGHGLFRVTWVGSVARNGLDAPEEDVETGLESGDEVAPRA